MIRLLAPEKFIKANKLEIIEFCNLKTIESE